MPGNWSRRKQKSFRPIINNDLKPATKNRCLRNASKQPAADNREEQRVRLTACLNNLRHRIPLPADMPGTDRFYRVANQGAARIGGENLPGGARLPLRIVKDAFTVIADVKAGRYKAGNVF